MLCWDDGIFLDLNDVLVSCDYDLVLVLSFFWILDAGMLSIWLLCEEVVLFRSVYDAVLGLVKTLQE